MNNVASIPGHPLVEFAMASMLTATLCGAILINWLWSQRAGSPPAWAVVKGIVVESTVAVERGSRGQVYRPMIRYHYEVGGECFEGQRIGWTGLKRHRNYTRARRVLDDYRLGHAVSVHYDSKRPSAAVLHPFRALRLQPIAVIASAAAMYVFFIAGPLFIGH